MLGLTSLPECSGPRLVPAVVALVAILGCANNPRQPAVEQLNQQPPTQLSQPVLIADDGWSFSGTQNILLVPENRSDPDSRKIALHYFRFPAQNPSGRPPAVFLGAGPGEPYSTEVFFLGERAEAWRFELALANRNRDVILINQRGNSEAPGLQINNFHYDWKNGFADKPLDAAWRENNRRNAYGQKIAYFKSKGVDLRGYDVISFVDDIESVRAFLGHEKLALIGNSFASQWALAYIKRYPEHVDRALFSGIEPLDYNYDDPDELWKVYQSIERLALADPSIAKDLPKIGLTNALKTVITRLEQNPENVRVEIAHENFDETIPIGAMTCACSSLILFPRAIKSTSSPGPNT